MSKIIYSNRPDKFSWKYLMPWEIFRDLYKHRNLIISVSTHNFYATYIASYLGLIWQLIVPLFMLGIFYFIFGKVLGGKFTQTLPESPVQFALALFVGLGFFNFIANIIVSSTTSIVGNITYVKSLSFPLEVLPLTNVITASLTLVITLFLAALWFLIINGTIYPSASLVSFYALCAVLLALGIAWWLSALAVFVRDITAITAPVTLVIMFMCPIFYPASMVPKKISWIMEVNPLAVIIEDARGCLLYGTWPDIGSMAWLLFVTLTLCITGYIFFIRTKSSFADVL